MKHPNNTVPINGKLYNFRSLRSIKQNYFDTYVSDQYSVFELNAKNGFMQQKNNIHPYFNTSSIQNGQFVFDNEYYLKYDVSSLVNTLDFGTEKDFTIQYVGRITMPTRRWSAAFVNSQSWNTGTLMIQYNRTNNKSFSLHWNGYGQYYYQSGHGDLEENRTKYHYALVRNENRTMTFCNGIKQFDMIRNNGLANLASNSGTLWIGANAVDSDSIFNGRISWFRISNIARYTQNFNCQEITNKF